MTDIPCNEKDVENCKYVSELKAKVKELQTPYMVDNCTFCPICDAPLASGDLEPIRVVNRRLELVINERDILKAAIEEALAVASGRYTVQRGTTQVMVEVLKEAIKKESEG